MSKFFKFTDFFRQITGRDYDRSKLLSRGARRDRKHHGNLSDRKLKLEELERRELLSVTNVVLQDAVDSLNKLTYDKLTYDGEKTEWTCGERSVETDTLMILQNAKGVASLQLAGDVDGDKGTLSWGIDGNEAFLSQYWTLDKTKNTAVWSGVDADSNPLAAPKREFTFYVWEDVADEGNTAGVLDAGEDYKAFTVSIQRAEITICVDQPLPGTNEAFGENYDTGHGFWDNRASLAIVNSGILGDDLADEDSDLRGYANKSSSLGASEWNMEEIIAEVAATGNYVTEGVFVVDNGTSAITDWSRVNVYNNTFVIDSLSDYIGLLEYGKDLAENTPDYVLMTANGLTENQCMTAALDALEAAGITTGLTGYGDDFEYNKTYETLVVPQIGPVHYIGTSPAEIGEALARTDADQATGAVRSTFNANYFIEFNYPQPDKNGIYSLTELREFYNLIQNAHLSDTDPLRAALENFVMNLSSYAQSDNVIYMDFDGYEMSVDTDKTDKDGGTGDIVIVTPRYSLDGDETRTYFTCDELVNMFQAWLVTAEDFAPFNVNVTLSLARYTEAQKRGSENNFFRRVAIGGTCDDWYAAGILEKPSGGVSDPYSYTPPETPETKTDDPTCFVFANAMRGITIGNTTSHEVGHNLGLVHQGTNTGLEYYPGVDDWSPIMGQATGSLVQWANGEYPQANNNQDALAIIAENFVDDNHPTGYRPDDYAGYNKNDGVTIGDIYTATYIDLAALDTGETSFGGVIETNTDADYFMFEITEEGESYYFNVGGIEGITNLDVRVNVYYACGDLLRSVDPLDSYSAGFIFDEAPGVYYISVMGTGRETSADGVYSDYASLGMYDIRISKPQIFNVTTLADDGSEGSLRSAIEAANKVDRSVDVKIEFDVQGTFTLENGPLTIERSMMLKSVGQNIVISGGEKSSVFVIDSGATDVQFYGINVTGGIGTEGPFGPEGANVVVGGGIIVNGGNLTMIDCLIYGNKTGTFEPVEEPDPETGDMVPTGETTFVIGQNSVGGGVVVYNGSLTLSNTTVRNNESFTGGGIYNRGGTVAVYGGTISNNQAQEAGAGVFSTGQFKVNDPTDWEYYDKDVTTTFSNNTILNRDFTDPANVFEYEFHADSFGNARGGAVHVSSGTALLNHVTVSGNKVSGWFSQGAGLYVQGGGVATVTDSTFRNNTSLAESLYSYDVSGAGVYVNYGGSATLTRTSVTGNTALSSYVAKTVTDADGNVVPEYVPGDGDPAVPTTVEDAGGAGLYADGTLTLVESTVQNNVIEIRTTLSARADGNGSGPRVAGAGIGGLSGTVTVTDCAISGNMVNIYQDVDTVTSLIGGAGIGLARGSLTVSGTTITNNAVVDYRTFTPEEGAENDPTAQEIAARRLGLGGGIATMGAAVTVTDSVISGNTAATGAGIAVRTNRLTLTRSTVDGNTGALYGGGLYLDGTNATISNSRITNNATIGHGGGIYAINACTITINESSYIDGNSTTSEALAFGDLAGGGGIWMEGGTLSVNLSYIQNNSAESITNETSGTDEFPNRIAGGGVALRSVSANFYMALIENNSIWVETFDHSTSTSIFADGGGIFADGTPVLTMSNSRVIANSVTGYAAPSSGAGGIIHGGGIAAENANIDSTTFTKNELYGQVWNEDEADWKVEHIDLMANGGGFYGNGIITNSLFLQNNTTGISILNDCNAAGAAISSGNDRNNPYFPWMGTLTVNNSTITENMSRELYITWHSRVQLKAAMAADTPFDRIRNMPVYGTYFRSTGAVYTSNGGKNMVFNNNIAVRNGEYDNSYLWADYYSQRFRGQYMDILINDEKYSPVYSQAQAYKEAHDGATDESVLAYLENYTKLAMTEKVDYNFYLDLNYYIITDGDGNIIERSYFEGWNNLTSTNETTWTGSSLAYNSFRHDTSVPAASDVSGNNVYYDPILDIGNYISNKAYHTETVLDSKGNIVGYNVWTDTTKETQLVAYLPDLKRHYVYGSQYIDYDSIYNTQIDSYDYFATHTYTRQTGTGNILDEYGNIMLRYLGEISGTDYYSAYIRTISNSVYDIEADPQGYKNEENYYQNETDKCYYKIDASGEKTDEMVLLFKTEKEKEVYYEITLERYYGEENDRYYSYYYDVENDPLNYLGTHRYISSGNYIVDQVSQRQVLYHQSSELYDVYYLVKTGFVVEAYNYMLFKEAGMFNFQSPNLASSVLGNYRLNEWYSDSAYIDYVDEYPYNPTTMSGWTEAEYNNRFAVLSRYNYAIDTGKNEIAEGVAYDLNHATRVVNGESGCGKVVDRGAYEWQHDPGYGDPTDETGIFVTTLADIVADDGVISLREAIANYLAQSDYFYNKGMSITFADYILGGTITLTGGTLLINDSIRINGGGGADALGIQSIEMYLVGTGGAVFKFEGDGVNISLTSLDISGGTGEALKQDAAYSTEYELAGGAIYSTVNASVINITGCEIHDSGLMGHDTVHHKKNCEGKAYGGLIYQRSSDSNAQASTLNITCSSLHDGKIDHAMTAYGGAIYAYETKVNLYGTDVTNNSITAVHEGGYGGGIALIDGGDEVKSVLTVGTYERRTLSVTNIKTSTISGNTVSVGMSYTGYDNVDMKAYGGGIYVQAQRSAATAIPRVLLEGAYVTDNEVIAATVETGQTGSATASGGGVYLDISAYQGFDQPVDDSADMKVTAFTGKYSELVGKYVEQLTPDDYKIAGGISNNSARAETSVGTNARASGGGISSSFACVKLDGGTVSGNSVTAVNNTWGGSAEAYGGGIANVSSSILITTGLAFDYNGHDYVIGSVIDSNKASATANATATAQGGGIFNNHEYTPCKSIWGSSVTMDHTVVSENTLSAVSKNPSDTSNGSLFKAIVQGGGIYTGGQLDFVEVVYDNIYWQDKDKYAQPFNVEIIGNSASAVGANKNVESAEYTAEAYGGGIYYEAPDNVGIQKDITLKDILVFGNALSVRSDKNDIKAAGGGVYSYNSQTVVNLTDSSISGNTITASCPLQQAPNASAQDNVYYPKVEIYGAGLYTAGGVDLYQSRACVNTATGSITRNPVNYTFGGGIYNSGNEITLERGRFLNNTITGMIAKGGGIYNVPAVDSDEAEELLLDVIASFIGGNTVSGVYAYGGGLYNESMMVEFTRDDYSVNDYISTDPENKLPASSFGITGLPTDSLNRVSRVYDNSAKNIALSASDSHAAGGGIYSAESDSLLVTDATLVYGNSAATNGGGIWTNTVETVTINEKSKIFNNTAGYYGGGLFNSGTGNGTLTLDGIEMYGNIAQSAAGGAVYNGPAFTYSDKPASLVGKGSNLTATNVSVHDNSAGTYGGGFYIDYSTKTVITDSVFEENSASMRGGAIYNNTNSLTIERTEFIKNSATGENGYGGALCNLGNTKASITESAFVENTAYGAGGAIYNFSYAGMNIGRTDFTKNKATGPYGYGGAIYNLRGDLTLTGMIPVYHEGEDEDTPAPDGYYEVNKFSGNIAAMNGGAIFNETGTVTVTDYSFIENQSGADGGAIYNQSGDVKLNSTERAYPLIPSAFFEMNKADNDGGAIYNLGGLVDVSGYDFLNNKAGRNAGAIYNDGEVKDVSLILAGYRKFSGNSAGNDGGAIYVTIGDVNITDYDFVSNEAGHNGGAIFMGTDSGVLTLTGTPETSEPLDDTPTEETAISVFSENTAQRSGGAIYNQGASKIMAADYSFKQNQAIANGGAIYTLGNLEMKIHDGDNYAAAGKEIGLIGNTAGGYGGALYVKGKETALTHYNIVGNEATYDGGGIYISKLGATLLINGGLGPLKTEDVAHRYKISQNKAGGSGGGVYLFGDDYAIYYCNISANTSGTSGGGIFALGATGGENLLSYCEVSKNQAVSAGGGIYNGGQSTDSNLTFNGAAQTLENVLLADNTVKGSGALGGGIYQNTLDGMTVYDSTIAGNCGIGALNNGGGVYVNTGDAEFINSIIAMNTATLGDDISFRKGTWMDAGAEKSVASISAENTVSSSTVTGWSNWDDTDKYYDTPNKPGEPVAPLFVNPGEGDYHLVSGSVAIDNGLLDKAPKLTCDLDGVKRGSDQDTNIIDSGAYEYTGQERRKYQYVYGKERTITVNAGESFVAEIEHKVSTPLENNGEVIPYVTTLSLRVHYDSSYMTFDLNSAYAKNFNTDPTVADVYPNNNVITDGSTPFTICSDVDDDFDGDASTDTYLLITWNTQIPEKYYWYGEEGFYTWAQSVLSAGFTVRETAATGSSTRINFTAKDHTYDYDFYTQSIIVSVIAQNFDIDNNGVVDMATDVNLILRYFRESMRGDALRDNLLNEYSTRGKNPENPKDLETYLEKNKAIFDIGGDGVFTVGVDDVLLERYFAGYRGEDLIAGLTLTGERTTAEAIENYIKQYDINDDLTFTEDKYQVVAAGNNKGEINAVIGQSVTVSASHMLETDEGVQTLLEATTLSLRVHYDSEVLTFDAAGTKIGDQYLIDLIRAGDVFCVDCADTRNFDGDIQTDRYIRITWNEVKTTWWQGNSPMSNLLAFNFTVNSETSAGLKMDETRTTIRFTAADLSAGYQFRGANGSSDSSVMVNLESGNYDIDNDGLVNASQDANLFLRRVVESNWGTDITSGISDAAKRVETLAYIIEHIDNGAIFDIDGDGITEVRDANILVRYLSAGWRDHRLVDGLLDDNSTRVVRDSYGSIDYDLSGEKIAQYIDQFIPDGTTRSRLDQVDGLSVETHQETIGGETVDFAEVSVSTISLQWDSITGADSYTVSYRLAGDVEEEWTNIKGITDCSYKLEGLNADSPYEIKVQANSNDVNVVSSVAFVLENGAVTVKALSDPTVDSETNSGSFTVENFEPDGTEPFRQIEYTINGVTRYAENTDTVENLLEGEYTVRVRTGQIIDGVYYVSEWSPATTVTVEIDRVDAPVIDSVEVNGSQATVTLESIPTGADGFIWQYRKVGETEWSDETKAADTTFTIYTLSANTNYEFRVKSESSDPDNKFDSVWVAGTFATGTFAMTITPDSNSDGALLTLAWNPVPEATGYRVVYSESADADPETLELFKTNATSYNVTGLDYNKIYYVWVQAVGGDWANAWERTTLAAVENFKQTEATAQSVTLAWDAVTDAKSYTVEYCLAGTDTWQSGGALTACTVTLTGLAAASDYDVRITANAAESRYNSAPVSITAVTLAAITDLAAGQVVGKSITLSWDCAAERDYEYQFCAAADPWPTDVVSNGANKTVTLNAENFATSYKFRVRSVSGGFKSDWEEITVQSAPAAPTVQTPEAVEVLEGDEAAAFALKWSEVTGAVSYTVYWSTDSTAPTEASLTAENSVTVNVTNAVIPVAANETVYYFFVRAALGENVRTAWSPNVSAESQKAAPSKLAVDTLGAASVSLQWGKVPGIETYTVSWKEEGAASFTDQDVTGDSFVISGLDANTNYIVQVKVTGETVARQIAVTTKAADPINVAAAANSSSAITVTWNDSAAKASASYRVCWSTETERPTVLDNTNSVEVAALKVKISGLVPATTYNFWVQAIGLDSEGTLDSEWVNTSAKTKFAAPTSFSVDGFAAEETAPEIAAMLLFANATVPGFEIATGDETMRVESGFGVELAAGLADSAVAAVLEANEFDPVTDTWDDSDDEPNDGEIFTDEFLAELI